MLAKQELNETTRTRTPNCPPTQFPLSTIAQRARRWWKFQHDPKTITSQKLQTALGVQLRKSVDF